MKYIRTKTKIECVETKLNNEELFDYLKQFDNYKDDLIKVGDTIEELCDEFIAIYKDENKSARAFLETFGDYRQLAEQQLIYDIKNGWHIYGAIWTDWGLRYVAKINEKGELELL